MTNEESLAFCIAKILTSSRKAEKGEIYKISALVRLNDDETVDLADIQVIRATRNEVNQ